MEEFKCRLFRGDKIKGMQAVVLGVMLQLHEVTKLGELTQQVMQRPRNSSWFKEKVMLDEALESGVVLDEENMAFLSDNEDTAPSASDVLMAKLSSYDSATLSKVPIHVNYLDNHVIDQNMQEMQYSEQSIFNNDTDIDISKMNNQVAKCNEVDKENKIINEPLTAELERYKEQIKLFEERQQFNLNDREKYIDGQLRK
ncbi:hypothetical protein Tco_0217881, partial [Tanacetum coccineum]